MTEGKGMSVGTRATRVGPEMDKSGAKERKKALNEWEKNVTRAGCEQKNRTRAGQVRGKSRARAGLKLGKSKARAGQERAKSQVRMRQELAYAVQVHPRFFHYK